MSALETGFGLDIVLFFHGWYQPFTSGIFKALHVLGGEKGFLIILPLLFWGVNKQLGIRLFVLIMSNAVLMNVLKLFFARPRPFDAAPNLFEFTVHQSGYGLPSGHVWLSVVFAGFLALSFKSKPVVLLAVIWVMLMGISRMVLGVHYLQDVLLGWLLGVVGLWVFMTYYQIIVNGFLLKQRITQILYLVVFLLGIQFIAVLLNEAFEYRKSLLAASGVLVGGLIGLKLASVYFSFDVQGNTLQKIIRVALGLILLVCVYALMSVVFYQIFTDTQTLAANIVYQFRYVMLGVWVTFIIPWILSKLHLLKEKSVHV